eukprot:g832.t1
MRKGLIGRSSLQTLDPNRGQDSLETRRQQDNVLSKAAISANINSNNNSRHSQMADVIENQSYPQQQRRRERKRRGSLMPRLSKPSLSLGRAVSLKKQRRRQSVATTKPTTRINKNTHDHFIPFFDNISKGPPRRNKTSQYDRKEQRSEQQSLHENVSHGENGTTNHNNSSTAAEEEKEEEERPQHKNTRMNNGTESTSMASVTNDQHVFKDRRQKLAEWRARKQKRRQSRPATKINNGPRRLSIVKKSSDVTQSNENNHSHQRKVISNSRKQFMNNGSGHQHLHDHEKNSTKELELDDKSSPLETANEKTSESDHCNQPLIENQFENSISTDVNRSIDRSMNSSTNGLSRRMRKRRGSLRPEPLRNVNLIRGSGLGPRGTNSMITKGIRSRKSQIHTKPMKANQTHQAKT